MCYKANKKWRRKHPKKWQAVKKRYYAKFAGKTKNKNHKQRWTIEEISFLNSDSLSDRELHVLIGRSVNAIQVMRVKMKEVV